MTVSFNKQVFNDGPRNYVARFFGLGDGTGVQLTNYKIIDVASMSPPGSASLKIRRSDFKVLGGIVQLLWDAPAPVVFAELQLSDNFDWRYYGGQSTRGVANATGSVLLTTLGFDVGSSFDLTLACIKGVGTQFG